MHRRFPQLTRSQRRINSDSLLQILSRGWLFEQRPVRILDAPVLPAVERHDVAWAGAGKASKLSVISRVRALSQLRLSGTPVGREPGLGIRQPLAALPVHVSGQLGGLRRRVDRSLTGVHLPGRVAGHLARLEGTDDARIDLVDDAPILVEAIDDVAVFAGVQSGHFVGPFELGMMPPIWVKPGGDQEWKQEFHALPFANRSINRW